MLHEEAGYPPSMLHGIDYSESAVRLARSVAKERGIEGITFAAADWLDPNAITETYDLILDKGVRRSCSVSVSPMTSPQTYDAISLMSADETGRHPASRFPSLVAQRLNSGGFLLITSCNWTEDELKTRFAGHDTRAPTSSHSCRRFAVQTGLAQNLSFTRACQSQASPLAARRARRPPHWAFSDDEALRSADTTLLGSDSLCRGGEDGRAQQVQLRCNIEARSRQSRADTGKPIQ